jgi:NTE family protein
MPDAPDPNLSALCLSGGGYRATIFHLGALIRLNETGQLRTLDRISSVSGGSITSACLGMNWNKLKWDANGVAENLDELVVDPVRALCRVTIDAGAVIGGIFNPFRTIGEKVAAAYDKHLFHGATLQDLPTGPRFIINATNVQSGALWRFSRPYMGDYKVGRVFYPEVKLAVAVGASSAFPPILSPVELDTSDMEFVSTGGESLGHPPFTNKVILSDGGVYDNMGIETAWKRCGTVIVSDAGAMLQAEADPETDWARHSIRILNVIDNQVRSLRKRQIISAFLDGSEHKGAYWSMRNSPGDYPLGSVCDHLGFKADRAAALAATPTRLEAMSDDLQERLINLGYVIAAAALASHLPGTVNAQIKWPFPIGLQG